MSTNLYVGNLSFEATEMELQDLFAGFGSVTEANLVLDKYTRQPRGFAFITMATPEAARAAIEGLNGREFHGRKLVVNEARPREERGPRPGGGGHRGGPRSGGGGRRH